MKNCHGIDQIKDWRFSACFGKDYVVKKCCSGWCVSAFVPGASCSRWCEWGHMKCAHSVHRRHQPSLVGLCGKEKVNQALFHLVVPWRSTLSVIVHYETLGVSKKSIIVMGRKFMVLHPAKCSFLPGKVFVFLWLFPMLSISLICRELFIFPDMLITARSYSCPVITTNAKSYSQLLLPFFLGSHDALVLVMTIVLTLWSGMCRLLQTYNWGHLGIMLRLTLVW